MNRGEKIKIEKKTNIQIFITFILYQYKARNGYCCESLYSSNFPGQDQLYRGEKIKN